jgi:rare lipoprotein A
MARPARCAQQWLTATVTLTLILFLFIGCGGSHKQARVSVPPPPVAEPQPEGNPADADQAELPQNNTEKEALEVPLNAPPLEVETGLASWYGPPYHNRRGSNGEVYNMNALTAAHRTLPLGSIVRVTNIKTGHSTVVRITDRGPFVDGRILDLSLAAAKKVDVYQPGTAKVKIEVLKTPASLAKGGRWAVQIGGFEKRHGADQVADSLTRRYHSAKILRFASPVGAWWVRVRVQDDDRRRAEEVARDTRTPEGSIFLVRLD